MSLSNDEVLCFDRAMQQWEASTRRPDLDERSRVAGAIEACLRQASALALLPTDSGPPEAREVAVRRHYHAIIERLIALARQDTLSNDEQRELATIADNHSWDGLSCSCGGGWLVGHLTGCPEVTDLPSPADIPDLLDQYWILGNEQGKRGGELFGHNADAQEVRTKLSIAFIKGAATPAVPAMVEVGEAGSMPGTSGYTLAAFPAQQVPVGTKVYARMETEVPA